MVAITFDEFHAIRNRQRASADADAAAAAAAAIAAKSSPSTSDTGEESSKIAVKPRSTFSASATSSASASPEEEGDAGGRAAPASGSTPSSISGRTTSVRRQRSPTSGTTVTAAPVLSPAEKSTDRDRVLSHGRQNGNSAGLSGQRLGAASLGRFVELFEVQVAVVSIIFLDLVASTAQLLPLLRMGGEAAGEGGGEDDGGGSSTSTWVVHLVVRFLQSFTGFTIILFSIEVALLLAAFRRKFFRHLGYVLDLAVVSICLYHEMAGMGKGVRLLGALRVWRVVRVMNTALLSAEAAHDDTLDKVRQLEKRTQDLDIEKRRLQETIRREIDARKRVDKMLQGYKDEVETLNEALKIAAMDIAEARVPPGLEKGAGGAKDEIGEDTNNPGLTPTDFDTPSDRSASTAGGNRSEASESQKSGGGQGRAPPSSRPPGGRIYVLQDGTFQAR